MVVINLRNLPLSSIGLDVLQLQAAINRKCGTKYLHAALVGHN